MSRSNAAWAEGSPPVVDAEGTAPPIPAYGAAARNPTYRSSATRCAPLRGETDATADGCCVTGFPTSGHGSAGDTWAPVFGGPGEGSPSGPAAPSRMALGQESAARRRVIHTGSEPPKPTSSTCRRYIRWGPSPREWDGTGGYARFTAPAAGSYIVVVNFSGYQQGMSLNGHGHEHRPQRHSSGCASATAVWDRAAGQTLHSAFCIEVQHRPRRQCAPGLDPDRPGHLIAHTLQPPEIAPSTRVVALFRLQSGGPQAGEGTAVRCVGAESRCRARARGGWIRVWGGR